MTVAYERLLRFNEATAISCGDLHEGARVHLPAVASTRPQRLAVEIYRGERSPWRGAPASTRPQRLAVEIRATDEHMNLVAELQRGHSD